MGLRISAPSSAGVEIRVGFKAAAKSPLDQEEMRLRTFSRVASSRVECWRSIVMRSRAKSAGLVVVGQGKPRASKCGRRPAALPA